jgi:hypothetical protein
VPPNCSKIVADVLTRIKASEIDTRTSTAHKTTRSGTLPALKNGDATMKELPLAKVYQLFEPGPVVMLTTSHKGRQNVMTMSWQ